MIGKYDFTQPPRTVSVNANQLIAVGKVLVVGSSLSAGAAAGVAVLYDGRNAVGTRLLTLTAIIGDTVGHASNHGIFFENGLFVTVSAVTLFLTLSYYTIEEEKGRLLENGSD